MASQQRVKILYAFSADYERAGSDSATQPSAVGAGRVNERDAQINKSTNMNQEHGNHKSQAAREIQKTRRQYTRHSSSSSQSYARHQTPQQDLIHTSATAFASWNRACSPDAMTDAVEPRPSASSSSFRRASITLDSSFAASDSPALAFMMDRPLSSARCQG